MDEFEKVEVLREKANVSYEEAREAIKQADGDLLEAMVILEKQGKVKSASQAAPQQTAQSVYRTASEAGTQSVSAPVVSATAKNPEDGFFNKLGRAMDRGIRYLANNFVLVTRKEETVIRIPLWVGLIALIALWGLLPLVINNQQEYLKNMQIIKELDSSFDELSFQGHLEWGDRYYEENNYHLALFEYENCSIMKETMQEELSEKIEKLRSFINPETRIIRTSIDKGNKLFEKSDFKNSNKYFSKVMRLSKEDSPEYRLAKSKITNA